MQKSAIILLGILFGSWEVLYCTDYMGAPLGSLFYHPFYNLGDHRTHRVVTSVLSHESIPSLSNCSIPDVC